MLDFTVSVIAIDTIEYRAKTETRAVRKNVSLPAWMANLAEKRGINCSQILQEGLLKACELPAAYANALRRGLPASTTTAFATMIRNETSYTMSTGVRFGLSHPYHIF